MKLFMASGTAALLSVALLSVAPPVAAQADDSGVQKEVATARAHTLMAAGADSLKMTQAHLHHVINCLVGPSGTGFDAGAANPCKGQGDGALNDTDAGSELHGILEKAVAAAEDGVKATDLAAAQTAARKTDDILNEIK